MGKTIIALHYIYISWLAAAEMLEDLDHVINPIEVTQAGGVLYHLSIFVWSHIALLAFYLSARIFFCKKGIKTSKLVRHQTVCINSINEDVRMFVKFGKIHLILPAALRTLSVSARLRSCSRSGMRAGNVKVIYCHVGLLIKVSHCHVGLYHVKVSHCHVRL